jgi:hypothetical protein
MGRQPRVQIELIGGPRDGAIFTVKKGEAVPEKVMPVDCQGHVYHVRKKNGQWQAVYQGLVEGCNGK